MPDGAGPEGTELSCVLIGWDEADADGTGLGDEGGQAK